MRFFSVTKYALRLLVVCLMAIVAVGCKGPKEIPDEDLVKIFHDCFLANAYYNEEGKGADSLNIYEPIFERYGYTTADIRHTMKTFSQRKSAMLSDLVTAASERLEEEYRAEQYKVMILDTIDRVAQRTLTRIVYSDTLIRVNTLRDTSKLRIRINDIVPGDYTIRFEYLIDSLDENRNSRAEIHTLLADSTESLHHQVLDADAALAGGGDAAILAGNGVVGQMGAVAFQQVGQLNAKRQCALMDERKGQINIAGFIFHIGLFIHLSTDGHFLGRVAHDIAHLSDTKGDFLDLLSCLIHSACLL